jgi:hypothetical protein
MNLIILVGIKGGRQRGPRAVVWKADCARDCLWGWEVVTALCRPFFLPCQIAFFPIFKYILHDYVFQNFSRFTATQTTYEQNKKLSGSELFLISGSYMNQMNYLKITLHDIIFSRHALKVKALGVKLIWEFLPVTCEHRFSRWNAIEFMLSVCCSQVSLWN